MVDNVVTYETFRKFQRLEKDNDALQKLPGDFYSACREWIERKERLYAGSKDPTLLREIENVMMVIKDVMDRRERKLTTLALHYVRGGALPQNLLQSERDCFDSLASALELSRKSNLEKIKGTHRTEMQNGAYTKLKATAALESFVGTDGRVYGPSKVDDLLEVPSDVAKLLVEKRLAVSL